MLKKIISGGQSGADLSGLVTAKEFGIETGGYIPLGFKTHDGNKPEYAELYNIKETNSDKYPLRTFLNVKESDGTIRFAHNFNSAGEKCTLKAINQYNKPYFDVFIKNSKVMATDINSTPEKAAKWIIDNKIEILNVAGNSEKTCDGIGDFTKQYLKVMLNILLKYISA